MQAARRVHRETSKFVIQKLMTPQIQLPQMGYMTMLNNNRAQTFSMLGCPVQMRQFSSYPDHVKLEMPNLSPTMEKVSQYFYLIFKRVTSVTGRQRLAKNFPQVMFFAVSRQIRLQLIMKCRRRGILPRFCIQLVPRMCHWVRYSLFWLRRRKILPLSRIGSQRTLQLLLQLRLLLSPQLQLLLLLQRPLLPHQLLQPRL